MCPLRTPLRAIISELQPGLQQQLAAAAVSAAAAAAVSDAVAAAEAARSSSSSRPSGGNCLFPPPTAPLHGTVWERSEDGREVESGKQPVETWREQKNREFERTAVADIEAPSQHPTLGS